MSLAMQNIRTNPTELNAALHSRSYTANWLAGDGSDRAYFRISPGISSLDETKKTDSAVLMQLGAADRHRLQLGSYDWVEIQKYLELNRFRVPKILAEFPDFGEILIEDAGDRTLQDCVGAGQESSLAFPQLVKLYQKAFRMICGFLAMPKKSGELWSQRSFDQGKLYSELTFFRDHFLKSVVDRRLLEPQLEIIERESAKLAGFLATQSKYFVHRDFHSRNLMFMNEQLYVIDFQDARQGPAAYDLVSLCFDAYVPLSHCERKDLMGVALDLFESELGLGLRQEVDNTWKAMLLQRQLKALGSFAYLSHSAKKGRYMEHCQPALDSILASGVEDERWPFLSNTLLELINQSLKVRGL